MYMNSTNKPLQVYDRIPSLGQCQSQFVIGVAYDTFSQIFTIYYNNLFQHFNISCKSCGTKVSPYFLEGTTGTERLFKDTIHVNFGSETFHYGPPLGYKPWNQNWIKITCFNQIMILSKMKYTFFVSLILL